MAKLKIEHSVGKFSKIFIDGYEISQTITAISIHMEAAKLPVALIRMNCEEITYDMRDTILHIDGRQMPEKMKRAIYDHLKIYYGDIDEENIEQDETTKLTLCHWNYLEEECDPYNEINQYKFPNCNKTFKACMERSNESRFSGATSKKDKNPNIPVPPLPPPKRTANH